MPNYAEIKQHVRDVTHRTDLTDSLMDVWSQAVSARVNDELDANVLIADLDITPTVNPFGVGEFRASGALDVGYRVIEVSYSGPDGRRRLQPTSREQVTRWIRQTGDPQVYAIEGDELYVAPFSSIEYRVVVRIGVQPLSSDSDANVISNAHPNIYYYGMLQQAYEYARDFEAADRYRQLYENEIQRINSTNARRTAPVNAQMSGASAWV